MARQLLFWDVDTQIDFMLPGGKLYVTGAERIIPNLARLTQCATQQHIPVISSADAHVPNDPEFAQYPPHCIAGTPGQQKIAETQLPDRFILPSVPVALPADLNRYGQIIVEKQSLDVFTNPNVDVLLAKLGPREVVLYGVVTEICVARAARGLLDRGYPVSMVEDAICALDEAQARECLDEIRGRGATFRSTAEVA